MMNQKHGPDPAVQQSVKRLTATQLSPLEETMFQAWVKANQIDDPDGLDTSADFRRIYQQTGGKVLPPGMVKQQTQRMSDIQSIMQAQEAHDAASPIQHLMSAQQPDEPSGY